MFQSATLKLTVWYASILIAISLLFSIIIYSIASNEVGNRIGNLQRNSPSTYYGSKIYYDDFRNVQIREAETNLIISLVVTNICIWIAGSVGSYYLARRTLQPIQNAHEAQSRFTSDASHELRTPLASMKIELEVALRDTDLSKQEMRELLHSNLEEVNKLSTLSQTLLQLSRLDHDKIAVEKVPIHELTKTAVERFNKVSSRITLDKTYNSLNARANKSNVEQLLAILLDNALKYSPEGSTIHVKLVKQKNMVGFEVTNGGSGIPATVLPHIFDRFYQADSSRTSGERKGFGLGLALAKKLVELHSGDLTVTSAPDQDTTFCVLLPIFSKNQVNNK